MLRNGEARHALLSSHNEVSPRTPLPPPIARLNLVTNNRGCYLKRIQPAQSPELEKPNRKPGKIQNHKSRRVNELLKLAPKGKRTEGNPNRQPTCTPIPLRTISKLAHHYHNNNAPPMPTPTTNETTPAAAQAPATLAPPAVAAAAETKTNGLGLTPPVGTASTAGVPVPEEEEGRGTAATGTGTSTGGGEEGWGEEGAGMPPPPPPPPPPTEGGIMSPASSSSSSSSPSSWQSWCGGLVVSWRVGWFCCCCGMKVGKRGFS